MKNAYTAAEIIEYFGGLEALAERLGCTNEAIMMWRGHVPWTRAYELQVLSKGRFKVERMPLRKPLRSAMLTGAATK